MDEFKSKVTTKAIKGITEIKHLSPNVCIPIVGTIISYNEATGYMKIKVVDELVTHLLNIQTTENVSIIDEYKNSYYIDLRLVNTKTEKPYAFTDFYIVDRKKEIKSFNVGSIDFTNGSIVMCWINSFITADRKVYFSIAGKKRDKLMFVYLKKSSYDDLIDDYLN